MTNCLPVIYMVVRHSAVLTGSMAWQSVCWKIVMRRVRSIQSRIVKAVKSERWNKVKCLQRLLTRSYSGRLLAIRRVTENSGKRTAGIDGQKWDNPQLKFDAIQQLKCMGYKALPVRRIRIPKDNGKTRPLGIPTIRDRAMQALHLLSLDPISECLADENSYGFRPYRSCADAIARCFAMLCKKDSPKYILECDIAGCFDHISHDWLLENIPMDKKVLHKWLKAGYLEGRKFNPTKEGSPQGSVISPTLANMVLDGMEMAIDLAAGVKHWGKQAPRRRINPNHIHLIRYADDFVITSSDRVLLETKVKPAIESFLLERGLKLSADKTRLTHIEEGFDFLGQTVRKFNGKLLIKPSRKSVRKFLAKVKKAIKERTSAPAIEVVQKLSPMIRGWAMYHRHVVSKKTFSTIDHRIYEMLWHWSKRRHKKRKNYMWIKGRYFTPHKGKDWIFFGVNQNGNRETIFEASSIKIVRHVKIKAHHNPYDKENELYFESRNDSLMLNKFAGKRMLRYLYDRQRGFCLICKTKITGETGYNAHHLIPKYLGGKWTPANLVLLHPVCHIQVHQNDSVAAALPCSVMGA